MQINALPHYDMSDNPTGCCPRFDPNGWDDQELHFVDKPFVKATTWSLFHIPVNMGAVFKKTFEEIEIAGAQDNKDCIVLSRDMSPWWSEHYFAVAKPVPGQEMTELTGDYLTKVFEGPYEQVPNWHKEMAIFSAAHGKTVETTYFFYTTCPRCAKQYGKNYVVAVAKVHPNLN
jgi:Bacterial hydrolase